MQHINSVSIQSWKTWRISILAWKDSGFFSLLFVISTQLYSSPDAIVILKLIPLTGYCVSLNLCCCIQVCFKWRWSFISRFHHKDCWGTLLILLDLSHLLIPCNNNGLLQHSFGTSFLSSYSLFSCLLIQLLNLFLSFDLHTNIMEVQENEHTMNSVNTVFHHYSLHDLYPLFLLGSWFIL